VSTELEQAAGSVLVAGFDGGDVPAPVESAITEGRLGGVILFARNFDDVHACRALCGRLRSLASNVWIAIDQEGGRVQRLRAPFPELPPMRRFGASGRPDLARRAGALIGRALRDVGVHQDYAPVLDVDSNPENPVIGDRSFARDPSDVAAFGRAFIDGLQDAGVAACGKHFPGHGDTQTDSHVVRPQVRAGRTVLETRELPPFVEGARTDLAALMTAHVVYPALDPSEPATFSAPILHDLLRRRLGFDGVVVSDDLEMGAVGRSIADAAVAAVAAGCDQLLVCSRPDAAEGARRALVDAVARGTLSEARLREAAGRVARLRRRFLLPRAPSPRDELLRTRDALLDDLARGAV